MREALAKLGIGAAQRLFRIDLDEAGEIDENEQQIAQFVFDLILRSALAGLGEFQPLFVQLGQHFAGIAPSRSRRGGAGGDLLRFDKSGERSRDGRQQALRRVRLCFPSPRL